MEDEITFGVYIPSYKRYKRGVITGKLFENPKHVIRESQAQQYIDAGFPNVISVPDNEVRSYSRVYNWIVDNAEEDIVAIIDDDVKSFSYRLDKNYEFNSVDTVQAEFERLAQIIYDLGIGVAFTTATAVPWGYTSEFRWSGIPGAFKIVNRSKVRAVMDTTLPKHVDIDYVLQELVYNRICLNALYIVDNAYNDDSTNVSGSNYDSKMISASSDIMAARWGKYFSYDYKHNKPSILVKR